MTPNMIPITKAREFTGYSADTLHELNRTTMPGIVRIVREGKTPNGRRYALHVPTWQSYTSRLRAAS